MNKNVIHKLKESIFYKSLISTIIVSVVVPCISLAVDTLENPLKDEYSDFPKLLEAFLDIMLALGTPIVVFFFVYAGFMFVTSGGDTKKLETAKSAFFWTVVGASLVLGAKVILSILNSTITGITK
ncbi:MAG: TrbC/VirB2 family protein [bacterium]|nr:TrbC/VirB2 family protein [bacterium]